MEATDAIDSVSLTIRCDCCESATIHLDGGTVADLEKLARASNWSRQLGYWSCCLCTAAGRTPFGFDLVRVRLAE